jgi:hypothetical protein
MILSEQELKDGGWIENEGKQPVASGTKVDVLLNGERTKKFEGHTAASWGWSLGYGCMESITHWRLHKPENNVESTLYTHPPVAENAPKSLDDAYDNPLSKRIEDMLAQMPTDQSYYKAPETKQSVGEMIVNLKKKSVEQMAVEIFNQITGNSLTEKNVKDIISLVAVINEIKGE